MLRRSSAFITLPGDGLLGDELSRKQQVDKTPFAPRCNKDLFEEDSSPDGVTCSLTPVGLLRYDLHLFEGLGRDDRSACPARTTDRISSR